MSWLLEVIVETFRNLWAHKLRGVLTMFGVSWGIASIIFMVAVGDGFKLGYRRMLATMGTDVVILWGGRTAQQAGDQRTGRDVRLNYGDVQAIRQECYLVEHVSPELARQLKVTSPHNSGLFSTHGVAPIYQQIRSLYLDQGRLINENDFREERRVCVLGEQVKTQLFADRPAAGAQVRILDVPFTVIGLLKKKDQNNSYNGLDGDKVVIPYSTMARYFPDPRPFVGNDRLDNIIFCPVSADDHEAALRQVKTVLGRRHRFAPEDRGALWVWDTVEQARMVSGIYESMQIFLGFVAMITLGLGGIGVMNIMLVSVAQRTREIGIKQAVGATPARILVEFFLESVFLTFVSGAAGVAFAGVASAVVSRLPLPTLFAGLPITQTTALIAFTTLVVVGILAALYPAWRAARLTPVEALRYE